MGTNYYAVKKQHVQAQSENKKKLESYLEALNSKKEDPTTSEYEKDLISSLITAAHCHIWETPKIHIGKNSIGWKFTLNSSNFNSLKQLDSFISENPDYVIVDEYDRVTSRKDLQSIVDSSLISEGLESKKARTQVNSEGLSLLSGEWS